MSELKEIKALVKKFRDDRDWNQFHKPKDLAISLSLEASELLECFQWKSDQDIQEMVAKGDIEHIKHEVADVAVYLLHICDQLDIDLYQAIREKMELNMAKYPVEKSKGS
ncbi:MAG: nucleotide pyrophosphohydrolase, partial [Fusobacteriaceae bacterium]